MPLYAGKHAICAFLRNMRNMLRSHVRYKPVSLITGTSFWYQKLGRRTWVVCHAPSRSVELAAIYEFVLSGSAETGCRFHGISTSRMGGRTLRRWVVPGWVHAWWWAETDNRQLLQPAAAIRPQAPRLRACSGASQREYPSIRRRPSTMNVQLCLSVFLYILCKVFYCPRRQYCFSIITKFFFVFFSPSAR